MANAKVPNVLNLTKMTVLKALKGSNQFSKKLQNAKDMKPIKLDKYVGAGGNYVKGKTKSR